MTKTTAISLLIPSIIGSIFLFTNATTVNSEQIYLQNLKQYSTELSGHLRTNQFGAEEKKILTVKKLQVTMAIANSVKAQNCLQILAQDPGMLSGTYVTYQEGSSTALEQRECQVVNGQIVQDNFIGEIDSLAACQLSNTCVGPHNTEQIKVCRSAGSKRYCDADNLLAPPELVQTLAGSCMQNQTFGFDEKGIWVDKGCAAKFRLVRIPTAGEISRWSYEYLKTRDQDDAYISSLNLSRLQKSVEQRSKTIANLLRAQFERSLLVRKQSRDRDAIRKQENSLSVEAEKWTQEYIHNAELTSCDHLESEMDRNRGALYTGTYYFYSADEIDTDEHAPFARMGFIVKTPMTVDGSPTFCDFTRLVQKTSGMQTDLYFDSSIKVDSHLATFSNSLSAPKLPVQMVSAYVEPSCGQGLGSGSPLRCIAKKDVEYDGKSLYSFIDPAKMGSKVVNANGIRFCFAQNEQFKFKAGNIVHGYQCGSGSRLQEMEMDPYITVERGMMPGAQPVFSTSSLTGAGGKLLVGCLSSAKVAAHFERNQRSMLVSDDVQDLSSQIYKRSETAGDRYYCIAAGQPINFSQENLAEGYLYSKNTKYPRFKIIDAPNQSVLGWVDYVGEVNNQLDVRGWACNKGISKSISVVISLNNTTAKGGKVIATVEAKNPNESAVSTACQTTGTPHRFRALIPKSTLIIQGAKIFVEGLSSDSLLSNEVLSNSGKLSVP